MIDLERSLVELAERLEIPDGDWLVSDVVRRIGEPAVSRRRASYTPFRLAGAAVALAVVVIAVLPGPRHAVARWLGFDSVRIEPGVTVPTEATSTTTEASSDESTSTSMGNAPTSVAAPDLGLGSSVSIVDAISRTGLPDPTPNLLGTPQSVHVVEPPATGQIVLVYAASDLVPQSDVTGVGALVSVFPARIDEGLFRKTLGDSATVRPIRVDGARGYWIEGSPHQLMFEFGTVIQEDTLRMATNTLLWQRGDLVYRLEADVSLEVAVRIAESVS